MESGRLGDVSDPVAQYVVSSFIPPFSFRVAVMVVETGEMKAAQTPLQEQKACLTLSLSLSVWVWPFILYIYIPDPMAKVKAEWEHKRGEKQIQNGLCRFNGEPEKTRRDGS